MSLKFITVAGAIFRDFAAPAVLCAAVVFAIPSTALADAGASTQGIIGGDFTSEYPAIAQIITFDGKCTGTLVAPRVLLTAAHCVVGSVLNGTRQGTARFGTGPDDFVEVPIVNMVPHPEYNLAFVRENDVGMALLGEIPPGDPALMPWNEDALANVLGEPIEAVGYGVTDGETLTGGDFKRSINLTVDAVQPQLLGYGSQGANICQGDSGGPVLLDIGGVPTIVGVNSFSSNFCQNQSFAARTDFFRPFIAEVIAAWSGPCQFDINCVEDGCGEFPDPDCDICGLDGVCGANCGEGNDLDCFTSRIAGSACTRAEECGSGICDTRDGVCVNRCAEDRSCPEGLSCEDVSPEVAVCTSGGGGGGCCSVAGRSGGPSPLGGAFALGLWAFLWQGLGRRRRAPRAGT